jgi:MYXO-CTERM domain-containing protein
VHCNAAHACEAASATTGGGCSGPDCGVTASGGCSVRPAHGASPRGLLALLGVAAALARKRRRARQA